MEREFQEYDVVRSKQPIAHEILAGTIGTIVFVLDSISKVYLVEFVNAEGDTIDVITVSKEQIERIDI